MTKDTPPKVEIEWEPIPEGILLGLKGVPWYATQDVEYGFRLPMMSVRELYIDMQDAIMLARGYDRVDTFAFGVEENDIVALLGTAYTIKNILKDGHGRAILQSQGDEVELTLPEDTLISVYRYRQIS